jgi:hypothetical protein
MLICFVQHSVKKRQMASQYAYTNIMRPQIVSGIQDRASAFIRKCNESKEESMDAYVSLFASPVIF